MSTPARQILVVDDEPSMTRVISRLLAQQGWVSTVVDQPQKALAIVRERPDFFSVVITDMAMPGMSGDELARQLKAVAPNLPIILSTGGADGTWHLFAGILPKPFDARALVETVERCLRSR